MAKRIFLLDTSGSMEAVIDDTIGGFNSFVRSQVPLGGSLTLYTFSDKCKCVYTDVPIAEVVPLTKETYVPGGSTALYDSMGHILKNHKEGTFVVLTDGQDNVSRKYTKNHVKDLIRLSPGVEIVYVGVDIDEATDMGIQNTYEYSPERTPDIFKHVSATVAEAVLRSPSQPLSRMVGSIGAIDSNTQQSTFQPDPMSHPSQSDAVCNETYAVDPYA